jgi:hypothetical protein
VKTAGRNYRCIEALRARFDVECGKIAPVTDSAAPRQRVAGAKEKFDLLAIG